MCQGFSRFFLGFSHHLLLAKLTTSSIGVDSPNCTTLCVCVSVYLLSHQRAPLLACSMVCSRSWHPPRNPKLVWHSARLIKEGGCVGLSIDTLPLKDSLFLYVSEGSALTLPLFLLSPRIIMPCHCSSTLTKDHILIVLYGTECPLCADVPLNLIHSFVPRRLSRPFAGTVLLMISVAASAVALLAQSFQSPTGRLATA